MTTNQQLEISVLAAPLAAIDRRSLSQAWYSALHFARDGSAPRRTVPNRSAARRATQPPNVPAGRAQRPPATAPASAAMPHRETPLRPGAAVERRTPRLPLTRRIERALFERGAPSAHTSFAVGEGTGRVVVLLHASGERVRLVALCSPALKASVARALDQARFALAARGIVLDGGILEGEAACS
jgi:hypothetical protein